jgi:phenylacetate-CoA ligase
MNISDIIAKIKVRTKTFSYLSEPSIDNHRHFQWLSRDEIHEVKITKLKKIISIALNHVPYYHCLKNEVDMEKFSLDDLKLFPVITKEIIQEDPSLFRVSNKKGIVSKTSGSTGVPFQFLLPYESYALEKLNYVRAWGMGDRYQYNLGDPIVVLRTYAPKNGEPLFKYDKWNNYWYLSPFDINRNSLGDYVKFIKKSSAKCLRGYPSSVYLFTLLLKENGIEIPQIQSIFTSSEMLLPLYRQTIESYWGVKVLDYYGQNENVVVAQQCWAGNYHNSDDYGIIEVLQDNSIIGTNLNNYLQPFIRYDTKDKAICSNEGSGFCSCGRSLSIPFNGILGRSDDILYKADGTAIPTANFSTAMKDFEELRQFQIVQELDGSIILNLVLSDSSENILASIVDQIYQRLGDIKIIVNQMDEIPRDTITGKIKVTVQKLKI